MRTVVIAVGLGLLALACSSSDEKTCTPGAQVSCACPGGDQGVQVCAADGRSLGACRCGSGAGGSGGSGGSGPAACDPVAQTGCSGDRRCGLVHPDADTWQSGCVPAGTVAEDQPCTAPDPGPGAHDDCQAGLGCFGSCWKFCDPAADACGTHRGCIPFQMGAQTFGACEPTCDPLTQVRDTDGAAACGSADPDHPDRGCFGLAPQPFICAPIRHPDAHDGASADEGGGVAYANSCAPGAVPVLRDPIAGTPLCAALCRPAASSREHPENANGQDPFACKDVGSSATQNCRFWWVFGDPSQPNPNGNTLGVCLEASRFTYDDDNNPQTPEKPVPDCRDLSENERVYDPTVPDNVFWGCAPLP